MFTLFDVIVCIIILFTTIVAFSRGAAKDVLSLFSWVGASFITVYFYPFLFSKTQDLFVSHIMSSLAAIIPAFIVSLIILSVLSAAILGNLIAIRQGAMDRSIGALIGFVKGLVIVSIIHFCATLIATKEPDWLASGETYKLTRFGAEIVGNVADSVVFNDGKIQGADPEDLQSKFSDIFNSAKEFTGDSIKDIEDVGSDIKMDSFEEEFISEEIINEEIISE